MSAFATLPVRLTGRWSSAAAAVGKAATEPTDKAAPGAAADSRSPQLHAELAASGVTDPGGARGHANQDTFFTHCDHGARALVLGVFDGHGREAGRDAALAARDYFKAHFEALTGADYAALERDPQRHFAALFRDCHGALRSVLSAVFERRGFVVREQDGYLVKTPTGRHRAPTATASETCVRGGTTATVVVVLGGGRKLLVANVGDSAVALGVRRRGSCYGSTGAMKTTDWGTTTAPEREEEGTTAAAADKKTSCAKKTRRPLVVATLPSAGATRQTVTTPLILTGDHSPDNRREFLRARAFRCSRADSSLPELRFLFDSCDPRGKRTAVFEVDGATGELTQRRDGGYLKNVRDEWATLVASPPESAHPDSLAFTRSLGDFHMHTHGVSCEPSVHEVSLRRVARRVLVRGERRVLMRGGNQVGHEPSAAVGALNESSNPVGDVFGGDAESDDSSEHSDDNSACRALEFMLVAASDGVWDAWKHEELFRLLDAIDEQQKKTRGRPVATAKCSSSQCSARSKTSETRETTKTSAALNTIDYTGSSSDDSNKSHNNSNECHRSTDAPTGVHLASPSHRRSSELHHVRNSHIRDMDSDVLYHIGLTCSADEKQQIVDLFGDVRFFITGGSADRMTMFAQSVAEHLQIKTPFGYALNPIGSTSRYVVYKVGPVLIANHGMGMPSVSILLHEVTKLLEYAGADNAVYIRMGTSGGIGVEPGTVVITSEGVNNKMQSVDDVAILGDIVQRPSVCSPKVIEEITEAAKEVGLPFAVGKTLTCDDFYEGQGRLDGAICEYTLEDKMRFLEHCSASGVKNIEMEARGFAAFCHKLNIPVAVVCVTLLNRLLGDQVLSSHETLMGYEERPATVLLHYIKKKLAA
ncbi:hypothetical protein PybrP1_003772 [[Pythium] brassicae (nom. inval.)]|nr:hypothetical protein PybrP1_003772 [[Pythium] brassicae (nom. inval.)]